MPIQRAYNMWKTGIILSVKKYEDIDPHFPWFVVAFSKTIYLRDKIYFPVRYFSKDKTFQEACQSYNEIQETIKKHKFPR